MRGGRLLLIYICFACERTQQPSIERSSIRDNQHHQHYGCFTFAHPTAIDTPRRLRTGLRPSSPLAPVPVPVPSPLDPLFALPFPCVNWIDSVLPGPAIPTTVQRHPTLFHGRPDGGTDSSNMPFNTPFFPCRQSRCAFSLLTLAHTPASLHTCTCR